MRSSDCLKRLLISTTAVVVLNGQRSGAQEALRTALQSDAAARLRRQPVVRPPDDVLRWGPVVFDVSLGYSVEWSDNINYSQTSRESDWIQRPSATLGLSYQASPQTRLDLRMGVGYEDYLSNSHLDRFFVAPGSELA